MIETIRNSTAEGYTLFAVVISVLIAAVLTQVPALRFGSFWLMAGILIGADLIFYLVMKLGVLKTPKGRTGSQ